MFLINFLDFIASCIPFYSFYNVSQIFFICFAQSICNGFPMFKYFSYKYSKTCKTTKEQFDEETRLLLSTGRHGPEAVKFKRVVIKCYIKVLVL